MTGLARVRPKLHFTARRGWTNDPHGIVHVDGTYHMFFQYNPDGRTWSPRCHWGHALSHDLITWEEAGIALSPVDGEVGCWSGSAVIDDRGPAILYTRIMGDDWGRGQVAVARPGDGMFDWVRDPSRSVIDGPPKGLDITAFRDPQVRREGGKWKAVLGAGLVGFGGCALQYSSDDLEHWTFDGVIAKRADGERHPVWTGKVWECPQLLRIGDDWVMLMSAWADHVPHNVNYAIGGYDGTAAFTARRYGHLTHGAELYATTTFQDVEGRPCAMSWLRERGNRAPEGSAWCSAMSLPHVLSIVDDKLAVSQHPSLERVLATTSELGHTDSGGILDAVVPGYVWRLRFGVDGFRHGGFDVGVIGVGQPFSVKAAGEALTVAGSDGTAVLTMPMSEVEATTVDLVVDADILEVTVAGTEGIGSTRVPVVSRGDIRISATGGASIIGARLSTHSRP
jgi:beta-fructofuranosidase